MRQQNSSLQKARHIVLSILYASTLLLANVPVGQAQSGLSGACLDTIAGYSALCRTSVTAPNTEVTFRITKPDGSVVRFGCTTNPEGKGQCDLNFFHTRQSGLYKVGAYLAGYQEPNDLQENSFRVFPDTVSNIRSIITASKLSVAADGQDFAYVTVVLQDQYNNAVSNHTVELLSSRGEDKIDTVGSPVSNSDGKATFKIASKTAGIATLIGQDKMSNVTIVQRPQIVFYKNNSTSSTTTTSNILRTDIFGQKAVGGPASSLVLETPDQVQVNTPFDITVKVLDGSGAPALAYRGTVFFSSSTDSNASLPLTDEGYTFKGTDENASHTFAKATIFSSTGTQRLTVTDVDNPDLEAEKVITVVSSPGSTGNSNSSGNGLVEITSPSSGSTYGEASLDITGKMSPSTKFILTDSGIEIGNGLSDADGNFVFTAKNLGDGKHGFVVTALDSNDIPIGKSTEAIVFIDSKLPILQDVSIQPSDKISPNTTMQVSVVSEPKLSKVRVIIDSVAHDLSEDATTAGTYTGSFNSPSAAGEYEIKVQLVNTLGKESTPATNKKLMVSAASGNKVTGIQAVSGEKFGTVDLSWDALTDTSQFKEYVIYYDTNPLTLSNKISSTSPAAKYTVDKLDSSKNYYFAVAVVTQDGQEGPQSDIVPGTPKAGSNTFENLTATGQDGRVTLAWDDPGKSEIVKYKIEYGIRSGEYLEQVFTKDATPTWYIPDLINGTTYYFQISGMDAQGQSVLISEEVSGVAGIATNTPPAPGVCTSNDVPNLRIITRGTERIIVWDAVPGAKSYRVYSGTQTGTFNLPTREVTDTFFALPFLSKDYPAYFFAVKSVCGAGDLHESADFSNVLKVETGPEAWLIGIVSFLLAGWTIALKRKKVNLSKI